MTATVYAVPTARGRDHACAREDALEAIPLVARACVVSDGPAGTVALVTLDPVRAPAWAREHGIPCPDDLERLATHPAVIAHIDGAWAETDPVAWSDPAPVRIHVLGHGWLPGRDAFPDQIRRRCAKARYAPKLTAG